MAVLLFSLSTNHDDRPTCLKSMRCTLSLPLPLHNCITVDMLFNTVGHKKDGNYESWKYMGQNTARDRFYLSYFVKTTVNTLIEYIILYNMILCDLC